MAKDNAAFKKPIDYRLVYNNDNVFGWQPIAPNNYVAMGLVFTGNQIKPNINNVVCIYNTAVLPISNNSMLTSIPGDDSLKIVNNGIYNIVWTDSQSTSGYQFVDGIIKTTKVFFNYINCPDGYQKADANTCWKGMDTIMWYGMCKKNVRNSKKYEMVNSGLEQKPIYMC